MEAKTRFQRIFVIFGQEDRGYGGGREPSGYVRIEVRGNKGKLFASVQNLKQEQNRFTYKLYIISASGNRSVPVCAGKIPLAGGKGELEWEFNPDNVAGTGLPIDSFPVAAVLFDGGAGKGARLLCPLAGYRSGKVEWREAAAAALDSGAGGQGIREAQEADGEVQAMRAEPQAAGVEQQMAMVESQAAGAEQQETEAAFSGEADAFRGPHSTAQAAPEEQREEYYTAEQEENARTEEEGINEEEQELTSRYDAGAESKYIPPEDAPGFNTVQRPAEYPAGCTWRSTPQCMIRPGMAGTDMCAACRLHGVGAEAPKAGTLPVNIGKLVTELDKYFERDDPFRSRRRDYKWWKINSPANLNNLLYQFGIKSPVLFSPAVMMAHFKYRHMILGIYTSDVSGRELIVCGVPGVYNVDERPFGDMCRWVQLEGNKPRYGAFGYWLVYIDPESGKILSFK